MCCTPVQYLLLFTLPEVLLVHPARVVWVELDAYKYSNLYGEVERSESQLTQILFKINENRLYMKF